MNNRGQKLMTGVVIFLILMLMAFSFIGPLKESLDNNRGGSTLNCPGTPDFDQAAYASENNFEKIVYRPTCFITGISMVYFIGIVLIAGIIWVYTNFAK